MRTPTRTRPRATRPDDGVTAAALRRSRLALEDIEGQLGRLLTELRTGGAGKGHIDRQSPDRLRTATAEASAALAQLADLRGQLF